MGKKRESKKIDEEDQEEIHDYYQRDTNVNVLDDKKIQFSCKNSTQKKLTQSINNNEITLCTGPAGTGKTFVACAQALKLLKSPSNNMNRITIIKSVTTLEGEDIGFLKGDMEEKMEPFLQSFITNFEKILDKKTIEKMREEGYIDNIPIAFSRGINLDNCIVLIDEAQNISKSNLRRLITRIGHDSKMLFLGDVKQKDIYGDSGIEFMRRNSKEFQQIPGIDFCDFENSEIVRNPIIEKIEGTFDDILHGQDPEENDE